MFLRCTPRCCFASQGACHIQRARIQNHIFFSIFFSYLRFELRQSHAIGQTQQIQTSGLKEEQKAPHQSNTQSFLFCSLFFFFVLFFFLFFFLFSVFLFALFFSVVLLHRAIAGTFAALFAASAPAAGGRNFGEKRRFRWPPKSDWPGPSTEAPQRAQRARLDTAPNDPVVDTVTKNRQVSFRRRSCISLRLSTTPRCFLFTFSMRTLVMELGIDVSTKHFKIECSNAAISVASSVLAKKRNVSSDLRNTDFGSSDRSRMVSEAQSRRAEVKTS